MQREQEMSDWLRWSSMCAEKEDEKYKKSFVEWPIRRHADHADADGDIANVASWINCSRSERDEAEVVRMVVGATQVQVYMMLCTVLFRC